MGSDTERFGGFVQDNQPTIDVEDQGNVSDDPSWEKHQVVDATKFSPMRKLHIVIAGFTCTFNGNLGSSMPSGALNAISAEFGVTNRVHLILLNSLFMVGYVIGPLVFAPLSEYIGRRPVLIGTFLGYLIFMLACSGAPNYAALLVFRLLCGINAAAPTSVLGGLYADIFDDASVRGNAMALYMTVTTIGPLIGPIISGFSSPMSWRWPFWIAGMIAVLGLPLVLTLPETYAPVLHNKAVKKTIKKQGADDENAQQLELKPFDVQRIFLRPMTLLVTEPILFCTSAYLALAYSVFYLMFQAYPVIFQGFYGLSPAMAGLAFIPREFSRVPKFNSSDKFNSEAVGVIISLFFFGAFTWYHDRQSKAGAAWTKNEIYRRLPLACFASPLMVISLFWLGWTVWPSTSPIVPMLSGIFFGCGFQLLFMGMINYLTDVFRQYSASAHAAASMTRSIGAITLPLAANSMYTNLGVHWAPSVLGFIALAMGVIPFIFIRYGDRLARSSRTAREFSEVKG
ncbi:putative MFS-type transporter [Colletotrichum viniferum]|nr:putative MFS-type transporter [Colletotrichum viniferum]